LKDWLRVFRAQTAPATLLLVLAPYLAGNYDPLVAVLLALISFPLHYFSFGHNSLLDRAMGYDLKDPHKKHHPLVSGRIKLSTAHNVIHNGLCIVGLACGLITLLVSPVPELSLFFLSLAVVFGHAYNDGLSKECIFGFVHISAYLTCMSLWAWYLSHVELGLTGLLLAIAVLMRILFQIGFSGHLKDMDKRERSNILRLMGSDILTVRYRVFKVISPLTRLVFGYIYHVLYSMVLILLLLSTGVGVVELVITLPVLIVLLLLSARSAISMMPRDAVVWDRDRDLLLMSKAEVYGIFAIVVALSPLIGYLLSAIMMLGSIGYFVLMNKLLWETPYPKV